MEKVAALVLAGADGHSNRGRIVNAPEVAKELKEKGDEIQTVFDGAGTEWIPELAFTEMARPERPGASPYGSPTGRISLYLHVSGTLQDGAGHADFRRDGERFFNTPYRTGQTAVTLDQIEHVILRGQDGPDRLERFQLHRLDPRIHAGLNCAAISCPRLRQQALTTANVDSELNRAMRAFTADPRYFRLEDDTIVVSGLLDWFGEDFDRPELPAGDFLLEYMPTTVRTTNDYNHF